MTIIASPLQRGGGGTAPFPASVQNDLRLPYVIVADLNARNAIEEWRRMSYMECYVISDPGGYNRYQLGVNTTIAGQNWTPTGGPFQRLSEKNQPNGYVGIEADGYINPIYIKSIYAQSYYVADDETERFGLTTLTGDLCRQLDNNRVYIKINNAEAPTIASDWADITTSVSITSVNGDTGPDIIIDVVGLLSYGTNQTQFDAAVEGSPSVSALNATVAGNSSDIQDLFNAVTALQNKTSVSIPLYGAGVQYLVGNNVLHDTGSGSKSLYRCHTQPPIGTVPTNTSYWELIAGGIVGGGASSAPTLLDKGIQAQVTTDDGDWTGVELSTDPEGYVGIFLNQSFIHAQPNKLGACYWSRDGGTTALALNALLSGDRLYWNGSIATQQLAATDYFYLNYNEGVIPGEYVSGLQSQITDHEERIVTLEATGGGDGVGIFNPVQDITALKALNTTDAGDWPDKWAILVEDEGQFYRLDRDSAVSEALPYIVAPTTGSGRWFPVGEGKLLPLGAYSPAMTFNKSGVFSDYTPTSSTTVTFTATNIVDGKTQWVKIITDGTITFAAGSGCELMSGSLGLLDAGTYKFGFGSIWGAVQIAVPGTASATVTQLATPSNFTATAVSDTQINLAWDDVANESSYMLEWSPNGTDTWTQIGGTIAADSTSYNHTGLDASTQYFYRLSAVGDGITYTTSEYATANETTDAGDVTAPTLSGYQIPDANPDRIYFDSSEVITGTTYAGFTLGSGKTITGLTINTGQTTGHYFTVNTAYVNGDGNDTIAYSGTGSNIEDGNSNALESFTATTVTNNITAWSPSILNPQYFDATLRDFTGAATIPPVVNTNIYNAFVRENYAHVYCKIAPDDGNPSVAMSLIGANALIPQNFHMIIRTTGGIQIRMGDSNYRNTVNTIFVDGDNDYKVLRFDFAGANDIDVYVDGVFLETLSNNTIPDNQIQKHLYYGGLQNNDSSIYYPLDGQSKGIFIWGGSTDLTAQNLSDLDNYFNAL